MNRTIPFLALFILPLFLTGQNQNCGLSTPIDIEPNGAETHIIEVSNYFNDRLESPGQGLCEVNLLFQHTFINELEIDLISPDGIRINLVGPYVPANIYPTFGFVWDISFVRCDSMASPDFPLQRQWDNRVFDFNNTSQTLTGSYHPLNGCLETVFNAGNVNGSWVLEVRNTSFNSISGMRIIDLSLVFCDEQGNPCCFADAGNTSFILDQEACQNDPSLNLKNNLPTISPAYPLRKPDPNEYSYTFLVSENDVFIGLNKDLDFTNYNAGTYKVCGLSYLKTDESSIPAPDQILTLTDIRNDLTGPAPSFCGDITNDASCFLVTINPVNTPIILTESICPGETYTVGTEAFDTPGTYEISLTNQFGCDSLVELNLDFYPEYLMPFDTSICLGDTMVFGSRLITVAGTYFDTLQTSNGCDSILVMNLSTFESNFFVVDGGPDQTLNCQNETVILNGGNSDSDTNITYSWTGPGPILDPTTPAITVADPGQYIFTLFDSANGCQKSDTVVVAQNNNVPQILDITGGTLTCSDPELELSVSTAASPDLLRFSWSGPGIGSGADSPNPIVHEAGTYSVIVTNTISLCADTLEVEVLSTQINPLADPGPDQTIDCITTLITLGGPLTSVGPQYTYEWFSPEGNIVGPDNGTSIQADAPGLYTFVVQNLDNGCSDTAFVNVLADNILPLANAGEDQILTCSSDLVTIDGSASASGAEFTYSWSGPCIITPADQPIIDVNCEGEYILTVSNTRTGCINQDTVQINRDPNIPLVIVPDSVLIDCTSGNALIDASSSGGGAVSWFFEGNDLGISTLTPSFSQAGEYTLVITNILAGCEATGQVTIINDCMPKISLNAPPQIINCDSRGIDLTTSISPVGPNYFFEWIAPASDCIIGNANSLNIRVSCGGTYFLIATNPVLSLSDTLEVTVTEDLTKPVLEIENPLDLTCSQTSVLLDASINSSIGPDFQYIWTDESGNEIGNSPSISVGIAGSYSLEIINSSNGCNQIGVVEVNEIKTIPNITFGENTIPCFQDTFLLTSVAEPSNNSYSYSWTGPGIIGNADAANVFIQSTGVYQLEITDLASNCVATESITVVQPACPPCISFQPALTLNCNQPTQQLVAEFCEPCNGCSFGWTTTNGRIDAGRNTLTPLISSGGTYTITVIDAQGLVGRYQLDVAENFNTPDATAGRDQTIDCNTAQVQLGTTVPSENANAVMEWRQAGNPIVLGNSNFLTLSNPGAFIFEVRDTISGCADIDTAVVSLDIVAPQIFVETPPIINCIQEEIFLDASASTSAHSSLFSWVGPSSSSIISGSSSANPLVRESGTYQITLIDEVNGCSDTQSIQVIENKDTPIIQPINGGVLNCQDTLLNLIGNSPALNGFTFSWCLENTTGQLINCANTKDITIRQPGTYVFELTDDLNGCSSTQEVLVSNNQEPPAIEAGNGGSITCINPAIQLQGTVQGNLPNLNIRWTSPENNFISNNSILGPEVRNAGTYILEVQNLDNFCTATDQVVITNNQNIPDVSAGPDQTITCSETTVNLSGSIEAQGARVQYNWETANGNILSAITDESPVVNAQGLYVLTGINLDNGCERTDTVMVFSNDIPPVAAIENPNALLLNCSQPLISVNGSISSTSGMAPANYSWQALTPNQNIPGATNSNTVNIDLPGSYRLIVEDPENGCTDSLIFEVAGDFQKPELVIAPVESLTCNNSSTLIDASASNLSINTTLTWFGPDGQLIPGNLPSLEVNRAGAYQLSALNTDNGCETLTVVNILQDTSAPTISIAQPDILDCTSKSTFLDASASAQGSQFSYQWTTAGSGEIASNPDSQIVRIIGPGNYNLRIINQNTGCVAASSVEVIEIANPIENVIFQTTDVSCQAANSGIIEILEVAGGTPPFTYSLNGGIFVMNSQFNGLSEGTYLISAQGSDGCNWEGEVTIFPPETISVELGPDQTIFLGDSVALTANTTGSPIDSIIWEPVKEIPSQGLNTVFVTPLENTKYKVTVFNSNGCASKDDIFIKVNRRRDIFFPTAFSPDSDGSNEKFTLFAGPNVEQVNVLKIFNRWGEMVYSQSFFNPNDPDIGWDGSFNGELLNPAVFVYYAEVTFIDGRTEIFTGDVALIR